MNLTKTSQRNTNDIKIHNIKADENKNIQNTQYNTSKQSMLTNFVNFHFVWSF